MSPATRLRRTLLGILDLELRIKWLAGELSSVPGPVLEELCRDGERLSPADREVHAAVALALVRLGDAPSVVRLRREAEALRLLGLGRLLRRYPDAPASEPPRVPDYGSGRELSLGERRTLARRPSRDQLERLIRDPHPLVIRQLLASSRITEDGVVAIASRRPAHCPALDELARAPRWLMRQRVRQAVLLNPGAPARLAVPLVVLASRGDLLEVAAAIDLPLALRGIVIELLERRPPLGEASGVLH